MSNIAKFKRNPIKIAAIELLALSPYSSTKEVAKKLDISHHTINSWRKDPNFIEACYDRYMVEFGSQLPSVLNSMVREAQEGNVQAARLVLEHSGKLVKNINVTIDSPFEKFLNSIPEAEVVEDAEIVEAVSEIEIDFSDLPERKNENQVARTKNENVLNAKAIKEEEERLAYNEKQREWHAWRARAKKAGIEPLASRRPTPAQRADWQRKIEEVELSNA
jgi:hypothetical protein